MLPAFAAGRIVLARKRWYRLKAGDVVIIRHEGLDKLKRIQGIDETRVFVVGDNEAESTDSRQFGWLARSDVIGKAFWLRVSRSAKTKPLDV